MNKYIDLINRVISNQDDAKIFLEADSTFDAQRKNNIQFAAAEVKGKPIKLLVEKNLIESARVINEMAKKYGSEISIPENEQEIINYINVLMLQGMQDELNDQSL